MLQTQNLKNENADFKKTCVLGSGGGLSVHLHSCERGERHGALLVKLFSHNNDCDNLSHYLYTQRNTRRINFACSHSQTPFDFQKIEHD